MNGESKRRQRRLAISILAGVALTTLLLVAFLAWRKGMPVPSGELACLEGVAGNSVAILVDKSDAFTPAQQDELTRLFEKIVAGLRENDLLSIYILNGPEAAGQKPLFAMCAPKREGNALYENERRIRSAFDERFGNRLREIVEGAVAPGAAEASPIIEMIQRIARASYFAPGPGGRRTLFILSDMMQNTPKYSFYRQPVDFDAFRESDYGKRLLADSDLDGAEVHLVIIPREEVAYERSQQVKRFWIDFLRHHRVASVEAMVLP